MLDITLGQLEIYLFVKTRHDRSTWPHYKSRFKKIKTYFENRDFNPVNVGMYLMTLENLSTSTRCQYLDTLKKVCEILGVDYMKDFKRPKIINRKKYVLYEDEMKRLLNVSYRLNYRISVAIELSMRAGLRFNEIRTLEWKDLIDNELRLRDTKSGEEQSVYLPKDLIDKIEKLRSNGHKRIFEWNNGLLSNFGANVYFKKVLRLADIHKRLTFHDLRHTCATDLMNHDVNLHIIKQILRHKDIHTTEGYLHTAPTKLLEAAKKHSLAVKNWTKDDLIKEIVKFERTILDTSFKPSIEYRKNEVIIKVAY